MPDTEPQDAITYTQDLIKEISDLNTIKLFEDKNLMLVLKFLRTKSSMTVKDLEDSFAEVGEKKSDKSIYRYLKKLEEADLVVPAGKRVFPSDKKKIATQTLYMRTAKIFFPIKTPEAESFEEQERQHKKKIEVIGAMIGNHFQNKLKSADCLDKLITKISSEKIRLSQKLFQEADTTTASMISELEWDCIVSVLETIGLLVLLDGETDWQKELSNCFE
ncbi:MAG: hypothetical protein ACFE8U_06390 [Candidatus Hermodarchaeota archaeon]